MSAVMMIHKGVIVSMESANWYISDEKHSVTISALGEKYRLNDVGIKGQIYLLLRFHWNNGTRQNISLEWDTKGHSENFIVYFDGITMKSTFALVNNDVRIEFDDYSLQLGAYEDSIQLPQDTILVREITRDKIYELIGSLSMLY